MTNIRSLPVLCAALALAPLSLAAQGGGAAASAVMQIPAGARAAALSGAYVAASGDADVLFYNPAGLGGMGGAASLSYQAHVEETTIGSLAGVVRLGPLSVGLGVAYLDGGEIREVTPAPGGQRGDETGSTVGATESALRLAVGMPLLGDRMRLGAAAGFASSDLAGSSYSAPFFDVGAQAALPLPLPVSVGVSVRNLGGEMGEGAPLPTEARVGGSVRMGAAGGIGGAVSADFVSGLAEQGSGVVAGVEAGLLPGAGGIGAVLRAGYETQGGDGIAPLHLGAGLSLGAISVDYAFQSFEHFGASHRIGLRWVRGAAR